ncbi:MAG: helix-turn-helix domain-containing protein [Isosphaeraceae bacterium]
MNPPSEAKRRSSMRFEMNNAFWRHGTRDADLSAYASLVWLNLWNHADPQGVTYVSVNTIAAEANISRSSTLRGLTELQAKRMLKVIEKGNIHGKSNRYQLSPYPRTKKQAKGGTP